MWHRHYGIIPHNFSGFVPLLGSEKWRKMWVVGGGAKADWNKTPRLSGLVISAIGAMSAATKIWFFIHVYKWIVSVKASVPAVDATHASLAGDHSYFNPETWSCVLNCGAGTHISRSILRNNSAAVLKVLWNCLQTKLYLRVLSGLRCRRRL